jgi:hypothetical protein
MQVIYIIMAFVLTASALPLPGDFQRSNNGKNKSVNNGADSGAGTPAQANSAASTPTDTSANGANGANGAATATPTATATSTASADAATSTGAADQGANNNGGNNDNNGGGGNGGDAQSSTTLDPAVISKGFEQNGQATQEAGQVPSLTSSNNFINFCLTTNQPLTNGAQVVDGSCNPAPMGSIPAKSKMPSAKFVFPTNGGTVTADQTFTIKMAINNLATGNFVNADTNYFAAPQQLNSDGLILGHSHVVVEKLDSVDQTTPTDPTAFTFFKGLNDAAQNGQLTADVANGLPAGAYKLSSINTAANHQPCLVPVAQHGSLDDAIYFTVA